MKKIDLTHTLSAEIPTWDGNPSFEVSIDTDYADCTVPDLFRTQKIKCGGGVGTHMDAPAHVKEGGRTIEELNLEELITDCVVIDVSSEADESYVIMPETISKFESEHGEIKPHSFVIFYTGWDKRWNERETYINDHKFPCVDKTTALLLLERNISGLGIDTLSADTGAHGFPVHQAILGGDKYLVENVANAKSLPPTGARIMILPLKIKGGTESPIRLVALV